MNTGQTPKVTTKTNLNQDSFFYHSEVKVGRDFITRTFIDNKRHYFLEQRNVIGQLESSKTFTSLTALKREIRA